MPFIHTFWVNVDKSKQKQKNEDYTFQNCYIQGAPQKKQQNCFLRETPDISRKVDFCQCTLD